MSEEKKETNYKSLIKASPKQAKYEAGYLLAKKHNVITVKGENFSTIFVYKDGIYSDGEQKLRKEIQEMFEEEATSAVKTEIITLIKDTTSIPLEETTKDKYTLLPLENGVYDILTDNIIDYKPDYFFFSKLPVFYDGGAECPNHIKFFEEVLDEKDIPLVQELFGFCLFRKMFLKKAFILLGEKNTGKSTFLKVLTSLLGLKNIAGVSLQKLSNDKFAIGNLFRKYANIYDDLDSQGINNHGAFKIATGGGVVSGEKKFGDEFQFISYAKSIFACNKIPDVKDIDDDAYFDRWIVINFNKKIEKVDVFLDDRLKTREEVAGLFIWALKGLKRLLNNKKFTNQMTSEDTKNCMLKNSNSIASFVQDCLQESSSGDFHLNEEMYEAYRMYCIDFNIGMESDIKFHRDLTGYANYIVKNTSAVNKYAKQMRGYSGVEIKMPTNNNNEEDIMTF